MLEEEKRGMRMKDRQRVSEKKGRERKNERMR
jgi:hypothetical protein